MRVSHLETLRIAFSHHLRHFSRDFDEPEPGIDHSTQSDDVCGTDLQPQCRSRMSELDRCALLIPKLLGSQLLTYRLIDRHHNPRLIFELKFGLELHSKKWITTRPLSSSQPWMGAPSSMLDSHNRGTSPPGIPCCGYRQAFCTVNNSNPWIRITSPLRSFPRPISRLHPLRRVGLHVRQRAQPVSAGCTSHRRRCSRI